MSKQMRVSDTQFEEIGKLAVDLGVKRTEILNLAVGILKVMRNQRAIGIKIITDEKEVEMVLPMDMNS